MNMKKSLIVLTLGLLFIGTNVFAADGDLIVSGNVGVGTTSPQAQLHIGNATDWQGSVRVDSNGTSYSSYGWYRAGVKKWSAYSNDIDSDKLDFANNAGVVSLSLNQNGNIGIGTTTPSAPLHIGQSFTGDPGLYYGVNTNTLKAYIGGGMGTATFSNDFPSTSNLYSRVGLISASVQGSNDGGTTAIGLAGFGENSSIAGNAIGGFFKAQPRVGAIPNGNNNTYGIYSVATGNSTYTTAVGGYFSATGGLNNYGLIVASGNVGIGTTSPNAKLQVNGSVSLGSGSPQTNKALCWASSGKVGYCSTAIDASGSCTCNEIN